MTNISNQVRVFHELHQSGCFVIPNPWDLGSARLLAQLGFPALATTSAGFAGGDFTSVAELADLGVRRISVGGTLARAAWTGFLEAAREIATQGTFTGLARAVPFAEIDGSFS